MDNMAYLETISHKNNYKPEKPGFDLLELLKKIFTPRNSIIMAAAFAVLVAVMIIAASLNKADDKDREYLIRSILASTYLNETILDEYTEDVANSDLRSMGATLSGSLKGVIQKNTDSLTSVYGVEPDDFEDSIGAEEQTRINGVRNTLEDARLSGTLDRAYRRELTYEIMVIENYENEVSARTKNEKVKSDVSSDIENLKNIYQQFKDFEDPSA